MIKCTTASLRLSVTLPLAQKEFALEVKYGMTPMQALRSATATAAELLGMQDKIGSLEPGKFADGVAVPSDPIADITQMEKVNFVMKSGAVYNLTYARFDDLTLGELRRKSGPRRSCMIVVATDAPVDALNLKRLAARAIMGMARTGAAGSNGSGDYVIAFSSASELRIRPGDANKSHAVTVLGNEAMSPLFLAVIEATEEAIYNSLFRATTVTGRGHTVEALPLDKTLQILRDHRIIK